MTIKIELEFVPVSERLPGQSGNYVCLIGYGDIETHSFSLRHKEFNTHDHQTPECAEEVRLRCITHWAALPDLSKAQNINNNSTNVSNYIKYELDQYEAERAFADQQRRRDMFDKVAQATITIDDGEPSWMPEAAKKIAEVILKESDKFARGE